MDLGVVPMSGGESSEHRQGSLSLSGTGSIDATLKRKGSDTNLQQPKRQRSLPSKEPEPNLELSLLQFHVEHVRENLGAFTDEETVNERRLFDAAVSFISFPGGSTLLLYHLKRLKEVFSDRRGIQKAVSFLEVVLMRS